MKMSYAPAAAFVFAAAFAGASIAQPAPPSRDPSQAQGGTYKVGSAHTRIVFMVTHMGFTEYYGQFNGIAGELNLDPADVAKSAVAITIPTDSVDTSNGVLNGELKDPTWFDAAKYPTITFKSVKVTRTGQDTAAITGDLTFHGVTRPVTLDAKFNAAGPHPFTKKYTMGFNASTHLKRSDFGVTKYVPIVGDDVTLKISAEFEKVS
jgi:polyisoprenoid-binding protein YceI